MVLKLGRPSAFILVAAVSGLLGYPLRLLINCHRSRVHERYRSTKTEKPFIANILSCLSTENTPPPIPLTFPLISPPEGVQG